MDGSADRITSRVARTVRTLSPSTNLDSGGAVALEDYLRNLGIEEHRKVRAVEIRRRKARAALTREPSAAMFMLM